MDILLSITYAGPLSIEVLFYIFLPLGLALNTFYAFFVDCLSGCVFYGFYRKSFSCREVHTFPIILES